jgi:hypothetical protein
LHAIVPAPPELMTHWYRASDADLPCPMGVFEQMFFDHYDDADSAGVVRVIDWHAVGWPKQTSPGSRCAASIFPARTGPRWTKPAPDGGRGHPGRSP